MESGANKDQGRTNDGLLVEAGADKDQGLTDGGATPLFIAAGRGYLEVVGLLVKSGANKDKGTAITGATPLLTFDSSKEWAP